MIRHLARHHTVTVAAPTRSAAEAQAVPALAEHCQRVLTARISAPAALSRMIARLPTPTPSSMGYFYSPALAARIRTALAGDAFDLIVVHCSSVAQYVEDVGGVPKLLDFADMDSQKWLMYATHHRFPKSSGYRLEGRKLQAAETELASKFDCCSCITAGELETLRGFGAAGAAGWFPNGVDLDYFRPDGGAYDPNRLVFVGRMDYFPNEEAMVTFCRDVLPRIRARRPAAALSIVGADPSPAVRALARMPGVTVTGTVADVRPFVRDAAVSVAPLKIARGTQNKILESWALGVPVVASARAAAGVDGQPGDHLVVADDPDTVAEAILRLMGDAEERGRLATAGRAQVEALYTWDKAMQRFDTLIDTAIARHHDRDHPQRA